MRRLWLLLLSGSTVVVVAIASTLGAGSLAASGADHGLARHGAENRAPSARFLREARSALVKYLRHNHAPVLLVRGHAASANSNTTTSYGYNWSGYADTSSTDGTFSQVSGSWITPAVKCTKEDTITSEWVGLDGWGSSTVEQDGTISWCFEGVATYFTWYEMYPAGTVEVGNSLQPGDQITASISASGSSYTLNLTDSTNPSNSFSEAATCSTSTCLDVSAEWISERSSFGIGIAPLADYGKWTVTGASETANGKTGTISSYKPNSKSIMVDATDSYDLSTVSALSGGTSFSTTWHNWY